MYNPFGSVFRTMSDITMSDLEVVEGASGELAVANKMADMTKIRTQLDRPDYKEERNQWAAKV